MLVIGRLSRSAVLRTVVLASLIPACAAEDLQAQLTALQTEVAGIKAQAIAAKLSVDQGAFNAGDNTWVLLSAFLILLMTIPGLALFYGGLVRRHHVLGTMMQSLAICALVSVLWMICGFSLTFAEGGAFIGGFQYAFLNGVIWQPAANGVPGFIPGPEPIYAASIPFGTFCFFQLMFAIITPAVICGAYAERMKFSAMLWFSALWLFAVYVPLAHMVWAQHGLLNWAFGAQRLAVFDFAGGTVVETASGVSGLVCAWVLGHRKKYLQMPMPPHNLALAFMGAALLWVGWFGFNAGSALSAGGLATLVCMNTQLAAAAATLSWPAIEWIVRGKPTVLGAISGAVAGLVAITPACGFVAPSGALAIGALAGVLCFFACSWLKMRLKYDDSLDVFGVHGVAGMWGTIATGLFFVADVHPGLRTANPQLYHAIVVDGLNPVWGQMAGVGIAVVLSGSATLVIMIGLKYTLGIRLSDEDEAEGLDLSQHGEEAYNDRD
jgi:Amt family ammonium transporter